MCVSRVCVVAKDLRMRWLFQTPSASCNPEGLECSLGTLVREYTIHGGEALNMLLMSIISVMFMINF